MVLSAGEADSTQSRAALERLCRTYWYPLYAHVRRRGHSPADAQDYTQEFFSRLLESQSLANADPNRGRFRSFILCALNRFLIDEWEKGRTRKRGGGALLFSLDMAMAEKRFDGEPVDASSPELAFDRQWALTLLEEVLGRLEREYQNQGRKLLFDAIKPTLTGASEAQPYAELARKLAMSESLVKVSVHRLRKRYRELLQDEIANTMNSPGEVREEMRYLFQVLSGQ